jgi:hypothetical protein
VSALLKLGRLPIETKDVSYYAPSKIRKTNRALNSSYTYAPTISLSSDTSRSFKYAPKESFKRSYATRLSYDYSPSRSYNIAYYEEPITNQSLKFDTKYAPSIKVKTASTYAPEVSEVLNYQPALITRFKPQPVVVSNYDMLNSYFTFLVQLLKALR